MADDYDMSDDSDSDYEPEVFEAPYSYMSVAEYVDYFKDRDSSLTPYSDLIVCRQVKSESGINGQVIYSRRC